jgi:hypothetical protein
MPTPEEQKIQDEINKTHKEGVSLWEKIKQLIFTEHQLEAANAKRRKNLEEKRRPKPKTNFRMFDSTEVGSFPSSLRPTDVVAGYVDGAWQTFLPLKKRFPNHKVVSITVFGNKGRCIDIEPGNAKPVDAPRWVRERHAEGVKRPVVYADRSEMLEILRLLEADHIKRDEYYVWVADPTQKPHIPDFADACQWNWSSMGKNLDESLCRPDFLSVW